MPKLPKNLPPLPPVPEGYSRWEYKGKGYHDTNATPYAICQEKGTAWVVFKVGHYCPGGNPASHYIVAVRDPKPAPKRKGRVVAERRDVLVYVEGKGYRTVGHQFVLPADAASVERMVEQVAVALIKKWGVSNDEDAKVQYHDDARTALAAIGISANGGRK